jgi:hypothetical protein
MKGSRWFIVFVIVILALTLMTVLHVPKRFSWIQSYSHTDYNPFGCAIFDSIMSSSTQGKYKYNVVQKTFPQILNEHHKERHGYMMLCEEMNMSKWDVEAMLRLANQGNSILLATESLKEDSGYLAKALPLSYNIIYNSYYQLESVARGEVSKRTLIWDGDTMRYHPQKYQIQRYLTRFYFKEVDSDSCQVLLSQYCVESTKKVEKIPVAVLFHHGKGRIIVSANPLLFSNYNMVYNGPSLPFRLISEMGPVSITRIETVDNQHQSGSTLTASPFGYIITQPPLRMAVTLAMLTVIIFLLTSVRRRQWAIPVEKKVKSQTLGFVDHIGMLYYLHHDNADLVRKRMLYFTDEIRHDYHIEINDSNNDHIAAKKISQQTGVAEGTVKSLIRQIHSEINDLDNEDAKDLIDTMNDIIKKGKV